jgi:outer membrane PBP1 activator LpoA protein
MALITRRPWLALCALISIGAGIASCSLLQTSQSPLDRQEQAARLIHDGRHTDAARLYAEMAIASGADHDFYELQSADQWIAAANLAEAHKALATLGPDVRAKLPVLRALVTGELAIAEKDGAQAIRELDQIPVPTQPDEAASYWLIRGKGAFLSGHPPEGVQSFVERERYLADPATLRASRQDLYNWLRAAAERGNTLKVPPHSDGIVAGWLELAPVAADLGRDPSRGSTELAAWRKRYPAHPANESILTAAKAPATTTGPIAYPDQIALLLPLSGRSEGIGVAVRDGFLAAYFATDVKSRPHLRIYDVAAQPVAAAYSQAVDDGASVVVGPLTKEDVAEVAPLAAGRIPLLALNFLGESAAVGRNVYQYALLPEDEARMVARRVAADSHLKGIAILIDGELGNRIGGAFADELSHFGGNILQTERFEATRADFSDTIRGSLQVQSVKGEPSTHRTDVDFVFIAGNASTARLIVSQLKFHYAGDIPVYSTSDSFEPAPDANRDIDGLIFPDMPWMISADPVIFQLREAVRAAWPARTARRDRLYAFGFDAFRLAPLIAGKSAGQATELDGMTGTLHIDANNRIRRDLNWVQIKNGVPAAM